MGQKKSKASAPPGGERELALLEALAEIEAILRYRGGEIDRLCRNIADKVVCIKTERDDQKRHLAMSMIRLQLMGAMPEFVKSMGKAQFFVDRILDQYDRFNPKKVGRKRSGETSSSLPSSFSTRGRPAGTASLWSSALITYRRCSHRTRLSTRKR